MQRDTLIAVIRTPPGGEVIRELIVFVYCADRMSDSRPAVDEHSSSIRSWYIPPR